MARLLRLLDGHEELRTALREHQEAVAAGDLEAARAAWDRFHARLDAHSRSEDELLLPRLAVVGPTAVGGGVELFDREHRKLRRLAAAAHGRIHDPAVGALPPGLRVDWIEALHVLKELLAHHDERERAALHPVLEDRLDPAEADELARRCADREAELAAAWTGPRDTDVVEGPKSAS